MIANLDELLKIEGTVHIGDDLILLSDMSKLPIISEPRRSEHIIVALCLQGEAEFTVDTKERTVKPGDLIIIHKDRVTANFSFSENLQGMAMIWSKDYFDELVRDIKELNSLFLFSRMRSVVNLEPAEIKDVQTFCNLIKEKIEDTSNYFRDDIVQTLIMSLIYIVSNAIRRQQTTYPENFNRSHDAFFRFINLVEEHYKTERRVGWYAEQLKITPKYLSETIKAVSQRTPNEWIDNYVIREIRVQLRNSSRSIKEITEELHFPSQSFLGKFFKERTGMSPREYRNK
ncbi:MAG: helix-turn-helix transcriptional regulator [Bacteroidaceae bacterium]|nr:helix-turn-helix transcriptional regulator [Bacteroidaceae bacterium]